MHTDPAHSRKVVVMQFFKIQIFQICKVMESGLDPAKLWNICQMVATFLNRVHVSGNPADIPYYSLSVRLSSA